MSFTVKRKRGRPRLDEPREIKDFDINLIQEFKKFPVFYDRHHPQHRNREYTDRIWQRIAKNLNVSANLVKNRMLQLRNRFNLEKRRVEAMREEQRNLSITSQWSLYESLSFLSNYVKTRRPYSLQISYNSKANSIRSSSDVENEDVDEVVNETQQIAFHSKQITSNGNLDHNIRNSNDLSTNDNHLATVDVIPQHLQRNVFQKMEANKEFGCKYKAFGQFLTSSLIEMNEMQALNLVEKFTMEILKYLKTEERNKSFINMSQRNNTDGDDENTLTVY